MYNAPILDNQNFENITKALQILSAKTDKFHNKLVKALNPIIKTSPTGEKTYDWGENQSIYQEMVEKGFKFKPTPHESRLLKILKDYLLLEIQLQNEGKHPFGFTPSSFIRIQHFINNLSFKD
jgi:hypothetical protein